MMQPLNNCCILFFMENTAINESYNQTAKRVSAVSIAVNLFLSLFKLLAGVLANSGALISDAVHSASDVFSTVVVLIGVHLSSKEPDEEHPYGHERMECVAAILLAMVLFITGFLIGKQAVENITSGSYEQMPVPGVMALAAALVSILVKELMYRYTARYARKIDSGALMADAWHHRSDSLSSVGALVGVAAARAGYPVMDSVASLIIFAFIAKAAYDIFMDAVDRMVDHSCRDDTENRIREFVLKNENILGVDLLRTRVFGNRIYVDLEIQVDGSYTLSQAHDIAEEIHDGIETEFSQVKHIMIHVNPGEAHS